MGRFIWAPQLFSEGLPRQWSITKCCTRNLKRRLPEKMEPWTMRNSAFTGKGCRSGVSWETWLSSLLIYGPLLWPLPTATAGFLTHLILKIHSRAWPGRIPRFSLPETRISKRITSRIWPININWMGFSSMMPKPVRIIPITGMGCRRGWRRNWRFLLLL